ncbi:hypothetical protein OEZ86_000528 [Tetradesmus obliquus]|nr:hypothetical protein OEZ86_000528 [Tetradesmus obliquus]
MAAAKGGPGSSSNTATTSTRYGGANRPIPELTSFKQAVRRVNHQIQRISTEEHLLQTYAADGWKGASREKVRLTDELKRAELTVARCKEVIRQAARYCQEVPADEAIPADAFDSEGEVEVDNIFCAKCRIGSSSDDNDLVLCDGPCSRAFHECCLSPRLVAADIPEDEGWLCPACDAKMDILLQVNDYFGTEYEIDTPWTDLFAEPEQQQEALRLQRLRSLESPRAAAAAGPGAALAAVLAAHQQANGAGAGAAAAAGGLNWLDAELPSEDEDDGSYSEPDEDEKKRRRAAAKASGGRSGSSAKQQAWKRRRPSSDADSSSGSSEDDSGSGSDTSGSDSEEPAGKGSRKQQRGSGSKKGSKRQKAAAASTGSARKRRRRQQRGPKVDYKQLHEQLFGFAAFDGDDGVFKEQDDDDYESDSDDDHSD